MNYIQYFEYEKALVTDLKSVVTDEAKAAIMSILVKTLDRHKVEIGNLINEINKKHADFAKRLTEIAQNKTPQSVLDVMREYGFKELPEDDELPGIRNKYYFEYPLNGLSRGFSSADVISDVSAMELANEVKFGDKDEEKDEEYAADNADSNDKAYKAEKTNPIKKTIKRKPSKKNKSDVKAETTEK